MVIEREHKGVWVDSAIERPLSATPVHDRSWPIQL